MAAVAISWLAIGLSRGRDTGLLVGRPWPRTRCPAWSGARDVPAVGYAPVYPAAPADVS